MNPPVNSGESWSWSWSRQSGLAPCRRRKAAFSTRPASTATQSAVWPRGERRSRQSGPEAGEQPGSARGHLRPLKLHSAEATAEQTSACELQDGLVGLRRSFVEGSPASTVCLQEPVSVFDAQTLQQRLITWRRTHESISHPKKHLTIDKNMKKFYLLFLQHSSVQEPSGTSADDRKG